MKTKILLIAVLALFIGGMAGCAGGPFTMREKGAGIGALGGAAAGGLIGSAVGHSGAGAAIGGVLGLGAGALIGDQLQGMQNRQNELEAEQQRLNSQQEQLNRDWRRYCEDLRAHHRPPPDGCLR